MAQDLRGLYGRGSSPSMRPCGPRAVNRLKMLPFGYFIRFVPSRIVATLHVLMLDRISEADV